MVKIKVWRLLYGSYDAEFSLNIHHFIRFPSFLYMKLVLAFIDMLIKRHFALKYFSVFRPNHSYHFAHSAHPNPYMLSRCMSVVALYNQYLYALTQRIILYRVSMIVLLFTASHDWEIVKIRVPGNSS